MGYIDKNVVPGETLVYKTGCHWIVMFWPLLAGLVLAFFGFVLFAGDGWPQEEDLPTKGRLWRVQARWRVLSC